MQALRQVDILKKQLDELLPMKEEYKRELDKKIRLEFNYNSNHMEGNTLTYQETELLLIFDQSKGNHEMRELEEMKAHDVAYAMVEEWASDKEHTLKESDIRTLNEIILVRPFWKDAMTADGQSTRRKIKVGQYKEQPNSVQLSNGEMFHYASPAETPIKMGELIEWYREEENYWLQDQHATHPVALAAELHYRFVRIHPFDDGNGRISRLLMNYVLLKAGLPSIVIKSSEKKNYLQALHMADTGDLDAFTDYIAEQQLWSLNLYIRAAKGEGVDEPGDLDKKLTQLKKKLKNEKEVEVEKNIEVLNLCLGESIFPFIQDLIEQLKKFDSFFKSKNFFLRGKVKKEGGTYDEGWNSFLDLIKDAKYFEDISFIEFNYELSFPKDVDNKDGSMTIFLRVTFFQLVYEIECIEAKIKVNKLYNEVIEEGENSEIVEKIGNVAFNKLEAILGTHN